MNESFPPGLEPPSSTDGRWWVKILQRFFPYYTGEIGELVGNHRNSMIFNQQRSDLILSRVRLMALLFAVLTPLWIPLDIISFSSDIWLKLAVSRVVVGLAFVIIFFGSHRATTSLHMYLALGALFIIPSIFFLYSNSLLWDLSLSRASATMASGYAFLIFLMVAGLGIFPLTMLELIVIAVPLLGVAAAPIIERHLYMLPIFNALAVLWLLILVAAIGCLASLSQLQLLRKLFQKAVVDPLTGALNRESGLELIPMQFALAKRNYFPLSLAFVDLDGFKEINDTKGHEAGDRILVRVVEWWRNSLRKSDIVMRWGGDEFILLFPSTNRVQAQALIERNLRKLRESDGSYPTFSVGVAEVYDDHIDHWQLLLTLADKRMYDAKNGGKNRIIAAGNDTATTQS